MLKKQTFMKTRISILEDDLETQASVLLGFSERQLKGEAAASRQAKPLLDTK